METVEDVLNPGLTAVAIDVPSAVGAIRAVRVTATRLRERQNDFAFSLAEIEVLDSAGTNLARDADVSAADSIEAPPRWRRANLIDGLWPQAPDAEAEREWSRIQVELRTLKAQVETPERIARREALRQEQSQP